MDNSKCNFTLDQIVDGVLDHEDSDGGCLEFVRIYEKKVAEQLLDYTGRIIDADREKHTGKEEISSLVEDNAESVLDEICRSNRMYFKMGMKLGAWLFFQLLGK